VGRPLARHSIENFRTVTPGPTICLVGYRHNEVSAALGNDNAYVCSENPAGGTAFAVFEAFSVPELRAANPLVVITMGDRVVPAAVFARLLETHAGNAEPQTTGPRTKRPEWACLEKVDSDSGCFAVLFGWLFFESHR
jgi:bifunctional N-acetylglucosamine-1-phosphate-uridyltransferase/glucosamine-1-phosphate-acetyltransferase GlmU-like protein